jgi:hypothetical protein
VFNLNRRRRIVYVVVVSMITVVVDVNIDIINSSAHLRYPNLYPKWKQRTVAALSARSFSLKSLRIITARLICSPALLFLSFSRW